MRRFDEKRQEHIGGKAVVIGGSISGLCAARVLSEAYDEVVIFDSDDFPEEPAPRDGVPQSDHPHAMLEAGRATLEDLYDGFGEDLIEEGGSLLDAGTEMHYFDEGDYLADTTERLPMYVASRALFEHIIRNHTTAIDNIELRDGHHFIEYINGDDGVDGVTVRENGADTKIVRADIVVDAMGRRSPTPKWLEENGYPTPKIDKVEVDVTYSTIRVHRPQGRRGAYVAPPSAPRKAGLAALPIEGQQWEVIVQGMHGNDAPTEPDEFEEFISDFPEEMQAIVLEQEWTSDKIHHYPYPSSIRRRYEDLDSFPENLVVTGDAIASFNPIYGQGMSVAALDALHLHHVLSDGHVKNVGPLFFDRVKSVIDNVWKLAVGADFTFPETRGPKPFGTDLVNKYVPRVVQQAHTDPTVSGEFLRVLRLEQPATSLLSPSVGWRVLRPY